MKKNYYAPEIELIKLDIADLICTSSCTDKEGCPGNCPDDGEPCAPDYCGGEDQG